VGVNAFEREETPGDLNLLKIGREIELGQAREVQSVRVRATVLRWKPRWRSSNARAAPTKRDAGPDRGLRALRRGEIVDAMADVFGRYIERASF